MSKKQNIRLALLAKVARFLERTKITDFEFSRLDQCAMSRLPDIFPETWTRDFAGHAVFNKNPNHDAHDLSQVMEFFNLSNLQAKHLFWPNKQNPSYYRGVKLGDSPSKTSVAKNIRAFIKSRQALTK